MMNIAYPVNISSDEDGRILATIPDFPATHTDGATRAEALTEAADALGEAIARCIAHREDIPFPSPARGRPTVTPPARLAMKAAIYTLMRKDRVSQAELARRMKLVETEIRRMLDPKHGTGVDRLEAGLAALNRKFTIQVSDAA
jgi:antitoxin HicB